jgi:hypothetical protein
MSSDLEKIDNSVQIFAKFLSILDLWEPSNNINSEGAIYSGSLPLPRIDHARLVGEFSDKEAQKLKNQ